MQKIQILFPVPILNRLKNLSEAEDRPVSEIVRRAVDRYLGQAGHHLQNKPSRPKFPTFHGGGVLLSANRLKAAIYDDETL